MIAPRAERPTPPQPLGADHDLDAFDSGMPPLDHWLKKRARPNETDGASRTYVVCVGRRVIGYYALAAGSLIHGQATGAVRRNMPDPVPMALLGRLAIDRAWQGKGLGRDLTRDAILRVLGAADIIGLRAIFAHAISDEAGRFYERCGFGPSPIDAMTLMMTVAMARKMLESPMAPSGHP